METFRLIVEIVAGTGVLTGVLIAIFKVIIGFAEGQKALLRAEMLKIYYKYKDTKECPQYELENYHKMYQAYLNLRGNSFIKDVTEEVEEWTMIR